VVGVREEGGALVLALLLSGCAALDPVHRFEPAPTSLVSDGAMVWVALQDRSVARFDGMTWSSEAAPFVLERLFAGAGEVWGIGREGLCRRKGGAWVEAWEVDDDEVTLERGFVVGGEIWLFGRGATSATAGRAVVWRGDGRRFASIALPSELGWPRDVDGTPGDLWFAGAGGVARFDGRSFGPVDRSCSAGVGIVRDSNGGALYLVLVDERRVQRCKPTREEVALFPEGSQQVVLWRTPAGAFVTGSVPGEKIQTRTVYAGPVWQQAWVASVRDGSLGSVTSLSDSDEWLDLVGPRPVHALSATRDGDVYLLRQDSPVLQRLR
jgi:hypothetical protein